MNSSNTSQGNTPGPLSPYGPLSFSYNKKKSPSPGSAKRISLTSGMVRFGNDDEDDQNADDDSSSSSQEECEDPVHWSEDDGAANKDLNDSGYSILRKRCVLNIVYLLENIPAWKKGIF